MMRSYEEGLKCSSAALSRLQEEWAKGRLSLRDPIHDTRNANKNVMGSPNNTRNEVMGQRQGHSASKRNAAKGLRGLVSESMAMVTEIAVCMYNAGVCHEQLYRAPAALQAYLRTQAVLSLIPRQHPTAGALQQLLGPEDSLRLQMADLALSHSARTPVGQHARQHARPWRPSTASTNDTVSLVNAAWGDDTELEGDESLVPREGESDVLRDFSEFLQQEESGQGAFASPTKRARERNWKSSLGVVSDLEPGAGRRSDGGPDRSWPANRSGRHSQNVDIDKSGRVSGVGSVFGRNASLNGSRSGVRPQTATAGLGQARTISEGADALNVSLATPGWNLVSPQRPHTSGGRQEAIPLYPPPPPPRELHAPETHLAGGLRSRLRDELGAGGRATGAGMLATKYLKYGADDSPVSGIKLGPEGSGEWVCTYSKAVSIVAFYRKCTWSLTFENFCQGQSDEEPKEEQVYWGGRSRTPMSVVPVVLRAKEADAAGRPRRSGDWRWGAPVNMPVTTWDCYDGTDNPTPVLREGGEGVGGGRGRDNRLHAREDVRFPREGAIPRERPVTAPVCTF
jgi:hypothetical protein